MKKGNNNKPLRKKKNTSVIPFYKKWWFIFAIVFALIYALLYFTTRKKQQMSQKIPTTSIDSMKIYNDRGNTCFAKKEYDSAIIAFTHALRFPTERVLNFTSRGFTFHQLALQAKAQKRNKDMEKYHRLAISDYTNSIKINPAEPKNYYFRYGSYLDLGIIDSSYYDAIKAKSMGEKIEQRIMDALIDDMHTLGKLK